MRACRRRRFHAKTGQTGFSLIEMLVSLALFSVVLTMVIAFLDQAGKNLETEANGVETHQGARVALDELGLLVQQAGFGIQRNEPNNSASWQAAILYAGAHALAFNADLDTRLGALGATTELALPDGSSYFGDGDDESTDGAETYYYTIDANDDGRISSADRWASADGSFNPAASTPNPLDYALFRRVYGFDGEGQGGELDALTPYLFTNATVTDDYGDGSSPEPLFTYWLSEDTNGDDRLADEECVIAPCPPSPARRPRIYLWGDTNFDGRLSESEKEALRSLPVGSADWAPNPLAKSGQMTGTILSEDAEPGGNAIEVSDANGFAPGQHIQLGNDGIAERFVVSRADSDSWPNVLELSSTIQWPHDRGDGVSVLPQTLLRSVRTVQVNFGAIRPERDFDSALGRQAPGRAGRVGTRGLDYRVVAFQRQFSLPNLSTEPPGLR
jgi:prepilin-type N-terminal cleavage/methylation domain-containing protein